MISFEERTKMELISNSLIKLNRLAANLFIETAFTMDFVQDILMVLISVFGGYQVSRWSLQYKEKREVDVLKGYLQGFISDLKRDLYETILSIDRTIEFINKSATIEPKQLLYSYSNFQGIDDISRALLLKTLEKIGYSKKESLKLLRSIYYFKYQYNRNIEVIEVIGQQHRNFLLSMSALLLKMRKCKPSTFDRSSNCLKENIFINNFYYSFLDKDPIVSQLIRAVVNLNNEPEITCEDEDIKKYLETWIPQLYKVYSDYRSSIELYKPTLLGMQREFKREYLYREINELDIIKYTKKNQAESKN